MRLGGKVAQNRGVGRIVLKGTLYSLCFSLFFILSFAFCLKYTGISESLITPINQVIKGASIFLGVLISLKKFNSYGLICGLLIGFLFTIFAFICFSILSGSFVFSLSLLTDVIFGSIIGGICGIISVNLKKTIK